MDEEDRDLNKSDEWFRDRVNDLLGLGGAAFLVIAGWLISNDSVISLAHEADADKREAAIFLCVAAPVAWVLWYVVLSKIHSKCPAHPTVLPRRFLHLYAVGVGFAIFVVVYLAVDGVV